MTKATIAEIQAQHEVLRRDPQAYVHLMTDLIKTDGSEPAKYFGRHLGWLRLNRRDLALADLDHALKLEPGPVSFLARGKILASLGRHEEALADFEKGEAVDPEDWRDSAGYLHVATSLAALGREMAARAACAKMPNDTWSPGLHGTPRGDKAEITAEIQRRARSAAGIG